MKLFSYFIPLWVYCFALASPNPLINRPNQPTQTVTRAVPYMPDIKTVTCTVTKLIEKHLVQKKTKTQWKVKTKTAVKTITGKSKIMTRTKTATPKPYTIYKTKTYTFATRPGSTPPITVTKTIFKTPKAATRTVTSLTTTFRIITPSCPVSTSTFTASSTATGSSSSTQATVTVTKVSSLTDTLLETITVTETANPTSSGPSLPTSTTAAAGRTVTVTTVETSRVTVTEAPACTPTPQPTTSSSSSILTTISTPTTTSDPTTPPPTSTSTTLDPTPTITPLCTIPAISNGDFESSSLSPWTQTISSGKINAETSGLLSLFNHTPNGRRSWLFEYTTSSITITLSQPARFCPVGDKTPYRVSLWMRKISNPNGYECSVTVKINGAEVGRTKASRETMDWTLVGPFSFVLGEKGVGASEEGEVRIGVICEGTLATSRMMALDDVVVEPARVDQ